MRHNLLLLTNNPLAAVAFASRCQVRCEPDLDYAGMLRSALDLLIAGGRLLTHPLAGSLKPHQTPFRSLVLDLAAQGPDGEGRRLLSQALAAVERQMNGKEPPRWSPAITEDLGRVDLSLLTGAWDHIAQFK